LEKKFHHIDEFVVLVDVDPGIFDDEAAVFVEG
jgi:hypothetical protein